MTIAGKRAERPMMTEEEWAVVVDICRNKRVFEFGSGASTRELCKVAASVTTVEHDPGWAIGTISESPTAQVLYHPPGRPWSDAEGDGDLAPFIDYVFSLTANAYPDVIIIDGRARVACAKRVFTSVSAVVVLVHDADRPEYARIFTDYLREVRRVGTLAICEVR